MTRQNYSKIEAGLLLMTFMVIIVSFYFQYVKGMQPCPLCLMQRFCTVIVLIFTLLGFLAKNLARARIISVVQLVSGVAGMFFATRQLWLQSLPVEQAPSCIPGLDVLMKYFPWRDVFHAMLWGSGDCTEVSWRFLGLSIPAWSLVYFIVISLTSAFAYWRLRIINADDTNLWP